MKGVVGCTLAGLGLEAAAWAFFSLTFQTCAKAFSRGSYPFLKAWFKGNSRDSRLFQGAPMLFKGLLVKAFSVCFSPLLFQLFFRVFSRDSFQGKSTFKLF